MKTEAHYEFLISQSDQDEVGEVGILLDGNPFGIFRVEFWFDEMDLVVESSLAKVRFTNVSDTIKGYLLHLEELLLVDVEHEDVASAYLKD